MNELSLFPPLLKSINYTRQYIMHTNKTKKQNKHYKCENTQWNVHNIVDQSKDFDAFIRFIMCLLDEH